MEKAEGKEFDNVHDEQQGVKDEIYTKVIRAGKRTYFFDVRATRNDNYYLTITESKKRLGKDDKPFYEKHKIFLYEEDFEKFMNGLTDAVSFIDSVPTNRFNAEDEKTEKEPLASDEYTNVEFEDLGESNA